MQISKLLVRIFAYFQEHPQFRLERISNDFEDRCFDQLSYEGISKITQIHSGDFVIQIYEFLFNSQKDFYQFL